MMRMRRERLFWRGCSLSGTGGCACSARRADGAARDQPAGGDGRTDCHPGAEWVRQVDADQDHDVRVLSAAQEGTRVSIFGRERWDLTDLKRRVGVVSAELPGRATLRTTGRDAVLTGFFSSSTLWPNLAVTAAMRARAEEVLELVGAGGSQRSWWERCLRGNKGG